MMTANILMAVLHLPLEVPIDGAQNIAMVHTHTEMDQISNAIYWVYQII